MSACVSAEVLARIAEGDSLVDPKDQQHAQECKACSRQVAFLRECIAAGIDEIDDEASEVDALLAEFRTEHRCMSHRIVGDVRFHRPAFVRRLLALALFARESDTRLALSYSKAATGIVEVLARGQLDLADLRFDAWRYHSMLLREMGRYDPCREAFVTADEAAASATDPELSQAIILLSRALLAIEPDVWDPEEGRALLDRAERVFARRDPDRLTTTKTTRGMLAIRAGDASAAATIFAEVLAATPRDDEGAHADALGNYLWAAVHAGRADEDIARRVEALERIDERRGGHLNVLRDRWMRGLLDLSFGHLAESVALLRDTMRGFEAKGHTDTSIRVGLDAVRALITAERYDECTDLARDLASRAIGLDQREPTRRRALTAEAMSYAREAAQRRMLTSDLAQSIGAYIDKITYQRPVDFVPPMPLHEM